MADIGGTAAVEFEELLDEFAANFDERGEVGAAVCVYVDGEPVVDLWGGLADREHGTPWREDTLVLVFSCTKGVTATCANRLIEQGRLDPDAPVAGYWPEFAANGKADIPVRWVLAHRAGLAMVEGDFTLEEALSWDPVVAALAAQAPHWEPGDAHGYHMRSYGWLVGEVVRRIDGRTIGAFFRDEIAAPLGLEFWIGLPEELEPRVATLVPPHGDLQLLLESLGGGDLLLGPVTTGPSNLFRYDEMWNRRELHACELPSSNGIGDARSLARLYASLIGEVDGVRALQPGTVADATVAQVRGPDKVILIETAFGLGYMLPPSLGPVRPSAFGHAGAGGSLAFADPDAGFAFAYVMNDLRFDASGDPRSERLVAATYRALAR